jgi:predicted transcriptional regulator
VPKVIVRLLKICLTKFCEGSARVRKLPNQNEKSKLEPIIDLLGRKARIAIQMIGIRVITIVIKMNNSKGILTLDL